LRLKIWGCLKNYIWDDEDYLPESREGLTLTYLVEVYLTSIEGSDYEFGDASEFIQVEFYDKHIPILKKALKEKEVQDPKVQALQKSVELVEQSLRQLNHQDLNISAKVKHLQRYPSGPNYMALWDKVHGIVSALDTLNVSKNQDDIATTFVTELCLQEMMDVPYQIGSSAEIYQSPWLREHLKAIKEFLTKQETPLTFNLNTVNTTGDTTMTNTTVDTTKIEPAIRVQTLIFGVPFDTLSDEQMYNIINQAQEEIESLKKLKVKPKKLKAKIKAKELDVQALVDLTDAR
jgi:hypothetical protein